ncbi:MAG: PD-(D/E)XK nuclease family protein [Roseinatronobacter sp.]
MIFAPQSTPRVFALPPGANFPQALAQGLAPRLAALDPVARARVLILVNSARMQRRVRAELAALGPGLMPQVRLVTEPLGFAQARDLPPAVPPLRRRLVLAQLVARLLDADPGLAPRAALYDLADSLARLFSEMQAEGVASARVLSLDVSNHSAHWARAQRFLALVDTVLAPDALDPEGRLRAQVTALIDFWALDPPLDPIIVAGSTGSRGTTALLMQAVARLPQGAIVLPGFDFDMPDALWPLLDDALQAEDHPQFRYRRLMRALDLAPGDVALWRDATDPDPARNRVLSLALRPAPVADGWLRDGGALGDLRPACARLSLIEAPTPRAEAMAIALALREAAEMGRKAALVTPDRDLSRMVAAALDRWRIVPDDSGGRPLALTAPGRLLRHAGALMARRVDGLALLTALKHPLTHSGAGRGEHLLHTRDLELYIRRKGLAYPDAPMLRAWANAQGCDAWGAWLADLLPPPPDATPRPLADWLARHLALTEALVRGAEPDAPATPLWAEAAGHEARAAMDALALEAPNGGAMSIADYLPFVTAYLHARQVRDPVTPHPDIMIWGTLEARVQGADLVIVAGLNEGVWPKAPDPDPWLNRRMRAEAGLLLPERQIGLSAHDFQQAACAPEVILSRAKRSTDAPTIPSRWLNRLTNLLAGLPDGHGPEALAQMQARGRVWLDRATAFEAQRAHLPGDPPALRPAPRPPVAARPRELSVTAFKTLIRDPYAIYASRILGLRPLAPLRPSADALLRGTVLHKVIEEFTKAPPAPDPRAQLLDLARATIAQAVPWPAAQALMLARLARVADDFLRFHAAQPGQIALCEGKGRLNLTTPPFTITAKADRIDLWPDGVAHVIDYKTGNPPSTSEQKAFDKQLLLQALMTSEGAFDGLDPLQVARITFVGLGGTFKLVETQITEVLLTDLRRDLEQLLTAYLDPATGYIARRALKGERDASDYDHLSRFGEWTLQDDPAPLPVGDAPCD